MIFPLLQSGFQGASQAFSGNQLEIILLVIGIILILTIAITVFVLQRRSQKKKKQYEIEREYTDLLEKSGITKEEESVIAKLAQYHSIPENKHHLLQNQSVFSNCVQKMAKAEKLPEEKIAHIRIKLGFLAREEGRVITSTTEIPIDQKVTVESDRFNPFQAKVSFITEDEIKIERLEGNFLPGIGTEVLISFQRREGLYRIRQEVSSIEAHSIGLRHTEEVQFTQYRQYHRKDINKEIGIRLGGSSQPYTRTLLKDLSGGGASVKNPNGIYKKGEDVELYIRDKPPLILLGEVVRVSEDGKLLHLSFPVLKTSVRDRLIGYILKN